MGGKIDLARGRDRRSLHDYGVALHDYGVALHDYGVALHDYGVCLQCLKESHCRMQHKKDSELKV
jgi:hypothetical protein